MATGLRVLRGGARWSLRNERSAAGDLWGDATLVSATFSSDVARLFPAGEYRRDGGVLADGAVGFGGDTLLSAVVASAAARDLAGSRCESSAAWRCVSEVCVWGTGCYRSDAAGG